MKTFNQFKRVIFDSPAGFRLGGQQQPAAQLKTSKWNLGQILGGSSPESLGSRNLYGTSSTLVTSQRDLPDLRRHVPLIQTLLWYFLIEHKPPSSLSGSFFLSGCHLSTLELRCPSGRPRISFPPRRPPSSLHHAFLIDTLVQRTNDFYFWQGRVAGSGYIGLWSCSSTPVNPVRSGTTLRLSAFTLSKKNTHVGNLLKWQLLVRAHTRAPRSLIVKWLINLAAWISMGWSRPSVMKEAMSSPRASLKRD